MSTTMLIISTFYSHRRLDNTLSLIKTTWHFEVSPWHKKCTARVQGLRKKTQKVDVGSAYGGYTICPTKYWNISINGKVFAF